MGGWVAGREIGNASCRLELQTWHGTLEKDRGWDKIAGDWAGASHWAITQLLGAQHF